MTIRKASEKDAAELDRMISADFPYKHLTKDGIQDRMSREGLTVFKKTSGRELAGFVEVQVSGRKGIVNAISVKQGFRRKGIGKQLLDHAVEYLKGMNAETAELLVKKENTAAKRLYAACGFLFERMHEKAIDGSQVEVWEKRLDGNAPERDYLN